MKINKIFVVIIILYLLTVLIYTPGFYLTNCTCSWQFNIIHPKTDCMQECYEYDEITIGQEIVNILLLNFEK